MESINKLTEDTKVKVIVETKSGKTGSKTFDSLVEANSWLETNKAKIKSSKIMEKFETKKDEDKEEDDKSEESEDEDNLPPWLKKKGKE